MFIEERRREFIRNTQSYVQLWRNCARFKRIQRNFLTLSISTESIIFSVKNFVVIIIIIVIIVIIIIIIVAIIITCCFLGIKLRLYLLEIAAVAFSYILTRHENQSRFTKIKYIICSIILSYNLVVTYFTYNVATKIMEFNRQQTKSISCIFNKNWFSIFSKF